MNNQQLIAYPQSTTEPLSYPTGEVILDLYKDEPIPLVLNVDNFTNIAEAATSYSKNFDIPGTKTNNLFFNHIYDITSDSNFNPHIRTKILVKEGTINTFEGYLQLNDITNKEGAINYSITLFSEVVNLKDAIGNKVFRDLDLSELNHLYNEANIENSWTGILDLFNPLPADSFAGSGSTTDVVKYPLVNWAGHITSSSGNFIGYVYEYFRPFVNALYLLRNIFRDAGYTFTSNFLENNTKFNKLYADFNVDGSRYSSDYYAIVEDITGTYTTSGSILNGTTVSGGNAALYDLSTDKCTAINDGTEVSVEFQLYFNNNANDAEIRLYHTNTSYPGNYPSGTLIFSNSTSSSPFNMAWGNILIDAGESCWLEVKGVGGSVSIAASQYNYVGWDLSSSTNQYLNDILLGFRGDVGQWDFFKSIIDMFKLVVLVDENNPTNLLIEPYKDWVDTGSLIDWTNKIDDSEIKYTPIDGLAKYIDFNFKEDDNDWITPNLNNPSTRIYGYNFISNIDIVDKDDDKVEISAISDTYIPNYQSPTATYPMPQIIDSSVSAAGQPLRYWENNLRLLYDNGVQTLPVTYSTLQGNFVNESDYLLFTAVEDYPITSSSHSIRFNTVSEPYSSQIIINNLYNIYWSKYIDELYHKDTRIVELEAYLSADDIYSLNFNDIILIKNKKFRIHKIDYRAGSISKLELITIKDL